MSRPRAVEDESLLPQAMALFWRRGFAGTGIRELEDALGMKAPSIYNRFQSKDRLFQIALEHYVESVVGWRIRHYLEDEDALLGLRRFFDTAGARSARSKAPPGCLLVNTSLEIGSGDPAVATLLRRSAQMLHVAFVANLQRLHERGLLLAGSDLAALAEYLHLGLQGLLVNSRLDGDAGRFRHKVDVLFALLPLTAPARRHLKDMTQ